MCIRDSIYTGAELFPITYQNGKLVLQTKEVCMYVTCFNTPLFAVENIQFMVMVTKENSIKYAQSTFM